MRWDGALTTRTMADGLRVEHLGWLPFLHLRRFMDEIVTVSEEQMAEAMRQLAPAPASWSRRPAPRAWPRTYPGPRRNPRATTTA